MRTMQIMRQRVGVSFTTKKTWKNGWVVRAMTSRPAIYLCFQNCNGLAGAQLRQQSNAGVKINLIMKIE